MDTPHSKSGSEKFRAATSAPARELDAIVIGGGLGGPYALHRRWREYLLETGVAQARNGSA